MKRIYKVYYTVAGSLSIRNLDFLSEHDYDTEQELIAIDAKRALREQGNSLEIVGIVSVLDKWGATFWH